MRCPHLPWWPLRFFSMIVSGDLFSADAARVSDDLGCSASLFTGRWCVALTSSLVSIIFQSAILEKRQTKKILMKLQTLFLHKNREPRRIGQTVHDFRCRKKMEHCKIHVKTSRFMLLSYRPRTFHDAHILKGQTPNQGLCAFICEFQPQRNQTTRSSEFSASPGKELSLLDKQGLLFVRKKRHPLVINLHLSKQFREMLSTSHAITFTSVTLWTISKSPEHSHKPIKYSTTAFRKEKSDQNDAGCKCPAILLFASHQTKHQGEPFPCTSPPFAILQTSIIRSKYLRSARDICPDAHPPGSRQLHIVNRAFFCWEILLPNEIPHPGLSSGQGNVAIVLHQNVQLQEARDYSG